MKLLVSTTSPYVRKVRVVALEKGLEGRMELVEALPWPEPTSIIALNPLGKIPALVTDEGFTLYDSPVICEYLDTLAPIPRLIPESGVQRWQVLRQQALADGMLDAAVQLLLERRRPPEKQSVSWQDRQISAIRRGVAALVDELPTNATGLDLGQITAAVALDYIAFRFPDLDIGLTGTPLATWHTRIAARPSFAATVPSG
jgi:glutathione S-transferase